MTNDEVFLPFVPLCETHMLHVVCLKSIENESIDNTNGSMWYGESVDAEAIDSEMTIIDSIGQRLTLLIDNVIGGGGQRFISLFCPYWVGQHLHRTMLREIFRFVLTISISRL